MSWERLIKRQRAPRSTHEQELDDEVDVREGADVPRGQGELAERDGHRNVVPCCVVLDPLYVPVVRAVPSSSSGRRRREEEKGRVSWPSSAGALHAGDGKQRERHHVHEEAAPAHPQVAPVQHIAVAKDPRGHGLARRAQVPRDRPLPDGVQVVHGPDRAQYSLQQAAVDFAYGLVEAQLQEGVVGGVGELKLKRGCGRHGLVGRGRRVSWRGWLEGGGRGATHVSLGRLGSVADGHGHRGAHCGAPLPAGPGVPDGGTGVAAGFARD